MQRAWRARAAAQYAFDIAGYIASEIVFIMQYYGVIISMTVDLFLIYWFLLLQYDFIFSVWYKQDQEIM
jgi:hypothetical protein